MDNQTLFVFKKQQQEYNMVKTLKKVSKQLQKASRLHKRQSEIVKKYVKKTENKRPKSRNRKKA
jgi:Mg2+ and Co2+ transporter CorA